MVIHIRWSKVLLFIVTVLLAISVIICFFGRKQENTTKVVMAVFDKQSEERKLLVYTFSDALQEQSNLFYKSYYTISPTVAYDSTYVKSLKDNGENIEITFCSLPYIGPHDTVGEDEITFQVKHNGEYVPISFRHLKSYSLPENLISLQKELPPVA